MLEKTHFTVMLFPFSYSHILFVRISKKRPGYPFG